MRFTNRLKIVAATLLLSGTVHAAVFDGQTLGYDYHHPTVGVHYPASGPVPYPSSIVVKDEVEIANIVDNIASLDISDTNLLLDFTRTNQLGGDVAFNGFVLTDLNKTIPNFTSVTINAISTLAGFDRSRIDFDANTIRINFVGLSFRSDDILSLDVTAVPEQTTIALLGLGLLSVPSQIGKEISKP